MDPLTSRTPPHRVCGQAAVEFVAAVPWLVLTLLVAGQLMLAGWAWWSASTAARAGARAAHVQADPARAARRALPDRLRRGARIGVDTRVTVRVRVPALIPGGPRPSVATAATFDAG
ncbi:MAG: hypothetical protein ACR2NA_04835 [Solirubrobacterales bacterium]